MEFKEILKEYLETYGLTQSTFAKLIGVKPGQVCEWLKGKAKPAYDIMKSILKNTEQTAEFWFDL